MQAQVVAVGIELRNVKRIDDDVAAQAGLNLVTAESASSLIVASLRTSAEEAATDGRPLPS